ncbi:MAG TPA: RIP metalloprotease RseP [Salinivirga sp.]|uniref:RIP metalloprotease RseP n=1 Tax=Salinivirga sp. TaxID=1970192 RepID=UPI002B4932E3|nr:RIP metalloprotease RseP [Salinivirga sp.]HKK58890.1 RIP metalloprotease RseP [Salinivirga sp.]
MEIIVKIGQFLLSLSILIVLHEFGHFFFARLFKTRVEKFFLFFNPGFSLFQFKKGETTYGLGWLPLGGYVKISGMIDESMDREQMNKPAKPYEFRAKPAWQRLLIMLGGVFVNFLLGFLIYAAVLYTWGEDYLPVKNLKHGVVVDSAAAEAGFKDGDRIVSLDGKEVERYREVITNILLEDVATVQVMRDGEQKSIMLPAEVKKKIIKGDRLFTPRIPFIVGAFGKKSAAQKAGIQKGDRIIQVDTIATPMADQLSPALKNYQNSNVNVTVLRDGREKTFEVQLDSTAMLGVAVDITKALDYETRHYSFVEAIPAGVSKAYDTGKKYLQQFKLIFSPETEAYKEVGGFITIGKIFPGVWNWQSFWSLTAFLSIMLAILNLLPIPALDGGHVMFLMYEIITGRKPGEKFMEYAQMTGMFILLALLIFANGNDIVKLFQ